MHRFWRSLAALLLVFGCCVGFCSGVSAADTPTLPSDDFVWIFPTTLYCRYGSVPGSSAGYYKCSKDHISGNSVLPTTSWSYGFFSPQIDLTYGSPGSALFSGRTYQFYVSWVSVGDQGALPSDAVPSFFIGVGGGQYIYPDLISDPPDRLDSSRRFTGLFEFTFDVTLHSPSFYIGYTGSSKCFPANTKFYFALGIRDVTDSASRQTDLIGNKLDEITDFSDSQQTELGGTVDSAGTDLENKLGVLSFADSVMSDFIGVFADDPGPAQLTLPGYQIEVDGEQYEVWADTPYQLSSLEESFGPLLTAVRFGTVVLVYAALISYLGRVLDALLHGSEVKEE